MSKKSEPEFNLEDWIGPKRFKVRVQNFDVARLKIKFHLPQDFIYFV